MEQVQPGVDERGRDRAAVDAQVLLGQVPAAGPDDHGGGAAAGVAGHLVGAALRRGVAQPAEGGVEQHGLAAHDVRPGRAGRVLQVGEPHVRAGVQGVDGRLGVGRAGDLDPPVLQARRDGGDLPAGVGADPPGGRQEAEVGPGLDLGPAPGAGGQQLAAAPGEGLVEAGDEVQRLGGEDAVVARDGRSEHLDVGGTGPGGGGGRGRWWSWSWSRPSRSRELLVLGGPASARVDPGGSRAVATASK